MSNFKPLSLLDSEIYWLTKSQVHGVSINTIVVYIYIDKDFVFATLATKPMQNKGFSAHIFV